MCNATDCTHTAHSTDADEMAGLLLKSYSVRTHNGTLTIYNPATGGNVTLRIKRQSEKAKFAPGKRIIERLTGPDRDHYSSWTTFGFVSKKYGVSVWKRYRGEGGERSEWEALAWLATNPVQGIYQKGLEYHLAGTCRRCNRTLTNRDSIISGIGPICAGRENETTRFDAKQARA